MNEGHSPFGGSSRKRYRNCPGSVAFADVMPPEPETEFAWRGTVTHALLEHCLREGERSADGYHGETVFSEAPGKKVVPVDADMIAGVNVALDFVWSLMDEDPGAELYVETRFVLDVPEAPDQVFGRNDVAVYQPSTRTWHIADYKNGYQDVDVEDNDQALFYAAGAVFSADKPISNIILHIIQPNGRMVDVIGPVKSWPMDAADILDELDKIRAEVRVCQEARDASAGRKLKPSQWRAKYLRAGDHCTYCPARAGCPVREEHGKGALEKALPEVADVAKVKPIELPVPASLSVDRIGELLTAFDIFEDWMKMVRGHALSLATGGTAIPGYKLVDKIARAKWAADEDTIASYLTTIYGLDYDAVRPPSLVGITEVERLLGKRILDKAALKAAKDEIRAKYVDKSSSGYNLVPDSHKGEARQPARLMAGVNI